MNVKKFILSTITASTLALSMAGISVSAASWSTSYGILSGNSYCSSWSTTGSPEYTRVTATTSITNATPYIYAGVVGYKNGSTVLSNSSQAQNSSYANTYAQKTKSEIGPAAYISGTGTHSIWSSSLSRKDYTTSF